MYKKLLNSFIILFTVISIFLSATVLAADKPIIILYTNDIHCGIEDNIGFAKVARYKQDLTQITPYIALVDAGDAVQGTPIGKLSSGESIINIMNAVGYDFAIPGNHEFDYGMPRFLELASKLNCGYYSANITHLTTGRNLLPAYKIMQFGDTKIALIGVTTPESLSSSTPAFFQDKHGKFIYSFAEDNTGKKLYDTVQKTINTVKNQGADYVILVAHLGEHGITPRWSSISVARNTTGIDVIIDGHSHETILNTVKNKQGKDVIITQAGTKLNNLGHLTIDPDGKISTLLIAGLTFTDPKISALINTEKQKFEPILNQSIGKSEVNLTTIDPQNGKRLIRNAETNLGDFVTDAYKNVLDTDIALCNGGGIRNEIPVGTFTYNDILTTFPFGNMCVIIEATGQQILDALEMGAKDYPQENGGFLQVSGLTYTIDSTVPSSVVMDEKGNFIKTTGAYRVQNVLINGKPLDLNKKYTVGGTSYILKLGGNGMTMFKNSRLIQDEMMSETDVIIEYIQNHLNAVINDTYKNPYGQGRIIIK